MTDLPQQTLPEIREIIQQARWCGRYVVCMYDEKLRLCDVIRWPGPDRVLVYQYAPTPGIRMLLVSKIQYAFQASPNGTMTYTPSSGDVEDQS